MTQSGHLRSLVIEVWRHPLTDRGDENVGKQYYRFLVYGRKYLHLSNGLAAARSGSGYPNPLPMVSIQRARHYARDEQHSVCDQANQAGIHVEGRRAAGIEIWPTQQGAGAVSAEKSGTREPRGCPG